MNHRRTFLTQLGALAAMTAVDGDELNAGAAPPDGTWDTSWIQSLSSASYRVVFNAEDIAEGAAMDYAETFLNHFHEAHGTDDRQTRPVIVFRRLGTPLALDDLLWDRYSIGQDRGIEDGRTRAPAK